MPSDRPICVVVGTGYTGLRVLHALPVDAAIGISRSLIESSGHEIRSVDLDSLDTPAICLPQPGTLLYTVPPATGSERDRRLDSFLARVDPAPVRIVYLSTSGVYGDRRGEVTRETDPTNPSTGRAKRRLAAEQHLDHWCRQANSDLVVLRVPGIYGPGRLGLEQLRSGAPIIREADTGPGNRIHVDDLAACCIAAMSGKAPGIYNVGDGDHRSNYWFRRTVASIAGLSAPPEISLHDARKTWSAKRLSFLNESRRLDTQKLHKELNVELRYADAEDGIRASLAESST